MKRISWVACPKCQEYTDQKVRRSDRNSKHVIVRRRECFKCNHIWHTIQYPEMIVPDIKAKYTLGELSGDGSALRITALPSLKYHKIGVVWLSDPALQWVIRLPDS